MSASRTISGGLESQQPAKFDQALINGKTLSPVDQMGVRKLRGYRINQILSKTGRHHRKDRNG